MRLHVENMLTVSDACRAAGLAPATWYAALKRPIGQETLAAMQQRWIKQVDSQRALYRAEAIQVARDIMHNDPNANTRLKAVEFLARDPERHGGLTVNVQQNNAPGAPGYEYSRPASAHADNGSAAIGSQAIEDAREIDGVGADDPSNQPE